MAQPISRRFAQRMSTSTHSFTLHTTPRTLRTQAPAFRAQARSQFRSYSSTKGSNPIKVWPFVAIIAAGSGAYALMVKQRADQISNPTSAGGLPAPKKDTPAFSPSTVTVLFVLGGPGAGKGTQCANLVRDYGFTHLSAGDLLRAEQDRDGSEFGELIKDCIKNGTIVPMEVTVQLLENAMAAELEKTKSKTPDGKMVYGKGKFLIDGFPRKMDQALKFEETVCPAKFVLFFDCPEEEMEKRLMKRGETSGRADDNAESIKKRFKTFVETSMPVVDYYEKQGRVVKILATKTPNGVYKDVQTMVEKRLGKSL